MSNRLLVIIILGVVLIGAITYLSDGTISSSTDLNLCVIDKNDSKIKDQIFAELESNGIAPRVWGLGTRGDKIGIFIPAKQLQSGLKIVRQLAERRESTFDIAKETPTGTLLITLKQPTVNETN